jgi:hypothetical protein
MPKVGNFDLYKNSISDCMLRLLAFYFNCITEKHFEGMLSKNLKFLGLLGFRTCSSSCILKNTKEHVSETGSVSGTLCSLVSCRIRMTDKVRNPSNPECYTSSSEPCRVYLKFLVSFCIQSDSKLLSVFPWPVIFKPGKIK